MRGDVDDDLVGDGRRTRLRRDRAGGDVEMASVGLRVGGWVPTGWSSSAIWEVSTDRGRTKALR